jgi:hypothetical protein
MEAFGIILSTSQNISGDITGRILLMRRITCKKK